MEPLIFATPRRAAVIAAVIAALTAVVFVLAANRLALSHIQRVDSAWLRLMVSGRNTPVTVVAKVFNILGLVYVTLPVRLAVAGYLAFRRQWWHLAAFAAAVVLSEALIGPVKAVYDRVECGVSRRVITARHCICSDSVERSLCSGIEGLTSCL